MPFDDIYSTYTQTLASSKTNIGIILLCIGYYGYKIIDRVELALTREPRSILVETILLMRQYNGSSLTES